MVMIEKTTKVPMKILYFFMISSILFSAKVQKQDILCNTSKANKTIFLLKKKFLYSERINLYELKKPSIYEVHYLFKIIDDNSSFYKHLSD